MNRKDRRLAEKEARRRDGKRRNTLSEQKGKRQAIYRAGRVKEAR
jgi:hypothetical protein